VGQIDVITITLTTRSIDVFAGDMFCWPTAHFSCQEFLSKPNLSLQKAGLRAGSGLQNLLSWPALAPLTPVAYMQELSEFRTCCRGSPEVSFPTLSARFLRSFEGSAIPRLASKERTRTWGSRRISCLRCGSPPTGRDVRQSVAALSCAPHQRRHGIPR
jgi:hypothetical protein